jgi:hypothetical protein
MSTSDHSTRRGQLLAAVSVLGVSLGMATPALARDPTAVENPTAVQTSQKGTQTSLKVTTQTSIKGSVDQNSLKTPAVQTSQKGATVPAAGAASPAP